MANKFLIGLGVATILGAINKNNKDKNSESKNKNSRSKKYKNSRSKKNKVELEEKYFIDQFNRVHKIKFSQKLIDVIKKGAYLVIDNAVFKLYHGPDDKLYLRSFILDKNNFKELNEGKEISIADHKFRIFVNKKNNKRIIGCAYKDAKKLRGSFSETTTASFSVGAIDGADDYTEMPPTFAYDMGIGLSTSFTGEDSLDVAIDSGASAGATAFNTDGSGDALAVDGITYTFPLGGTTMVVGDSTDISASFTGACTYGAFADATLDDCGTGNSIGVAGTGVAQSYAFDSGFSSAGGVSSSETGIMSGVDADDFYDIDAYTADYYGASVTYAGAGAENPYWGVNAVYQPIDSPFSISAGYEFGDTGEETGAVDTTAYFVGLSPEVGAGSLAAASTNYANTYDFAGTSANFEDATVDDYVYEASYSYPVNDGITITPGVFIQEEAADDTGVIVKTSFSF